MSEGLIQIFYLRKLIKEKSQINKIFILVSTLCLSNVCFADSLLGANRLAFEYDDPPSQNSTLDENQETQVGRYVTVSSTATPEQINPLLAIIEIKFPRDVQTVGEALHYVLDSTGYALRDSEHLSPSVKQTLTKPLAVTLRHVGPLPVRDALLVLMGQEVYTLAIDPVHRLIDFDMNPVLAKVVGE